MMDISPEVEGGDIANTSCVSDPQIPHQHLVQGLPRREMIKPEQRKSEDEVSLTSPMRRATLNRKSPMTAQRQSTLKRLLQDDHQRIAALKPDDWKPHSVKYRAKFKKLLHLWESKPQSITIVGNNGVCFEEYFTIGTGSYGTEVYICLGSDGIERAIKRLSKSSCKKLLKNERDILTSPNAVKSPRVVNYWFYDDKSSTDFCYLILNLYEQNLEDYIREKGEEMSEGCARKMICQVLEGLKALHTREPRILHRDLKPTNVLVDVKGNLALSDFGIGRFFPEQGATTYNTNNEAGSPGWVAFECVDWKKQFSDKSGCPSNESTQLKWKEKSEIQVAGMLAFYIFTKGKHPFGKKIAQMINLCRGNPVGLTAELSNRTDEVLKDLLSQMLAQRLSERPYVEQALKHPYFLSPDDQMKFLEAVTNEPKFGSKSCVVSHQLDQQNSLLVPDWKTMFHADDLKTLYCGGQKDLSQCDGKRYSQCLRLIRNALQHPGGKLRKLEKKGQAKSLQEYFLNLFPTLPLVVHQIIRNDQGWNARPALANFFPKKKDRPQSDED